MLIECIDPYKQTLYSFRPEEGQGTKVSQVGKERVEEKRKKKKRKKKNCKKIRKMTNGPKKRGG